jgi:hypothetical protein
MPDYDGAHFDPPAPVVQAALRCLESGSMVRGVELLLDSGADITLLPQPCPRFGRTSISW